MMQKLNILFYKDKCLASSKDTIYLAPDGVLVSNYSSKFRFNILQEIFPVGNRL